MIKSAHIHKHNSSAFAGVLCVLTTLSARSKCFASVTPIILYFYVLEENGTNYAIASEFTSVSNTLF